MIYISFSIIETQRYEKIEIHSSERRRKLFKVAWKSHRRQIIAACPALVQLVKDSTKETREADELYETRSKRERLRSVISKTLSEIGFISADSTTTTNFLLHRILNHTLRQLASDEHISVQAVAAQAMAQWRAEGYDKILFDTLGQWNNLEKTGKSSAYIRATVALSVGYASVYDPPDKLSSNICELFKKISNDQHKLVQDRFRRYTLPIIISFHLSKQLSELLLEIMRPDIRLNLSIALSISQAYKDKSALVIDILNSWHQKYNENKDIYNQRVTDSNPDSYDATLATIAIIYGEIQYNDVPSGLTVEEAFKRLQNILAEKTHPFVRNAVVYAIARQAVHHFEEIEPHLLSLVSEVKESERDDVVEILTTVISEIYLMQRRLLPEGEELIKVKEHYYPVWINQQRPHLTRIEKTVLLWLKSTKKVAQEVATQASLEFAKQFDIVEQEKIRKIREERQNSPVVYNITENFIESSTDKRLGNGFYVDRFAPWLATLLNHDYRVIVHGVFSEIFRQDMKDAFSMQFVLNKWLSSSEPNIAKIANLLERALTIAKRPKTVLGVIIFLLFLLWKIL